MVDIREALAATGNRQPADGRGHNNATAVFGLPSAVCRLPPALRESRVVSRDESKGHRVKYH